MRGLLSGGQVTKRLPSKTGEEFEASTLYIPSRHEMTITTPKAKGYKSAHKRHARRNGLRTKRLTYTHQDHTLGTETVSTVWEA
ncbi:hypothetical protein KIV65_gp20 [Mycobacterium phage Anthony]|uniref:Uncharacterized protein n=1 Tax=Mycobacterium phage Anthony TaxID=2599857 RepID=A0A5J6TKC4_9CAUD|nr:hypothetical protein KIV65_gp20 [Mycobacterium phage Anthony]QFG10447.1 hypothetical protein PBI_ANTHONY_77 [Mycobacterium phage Anthony]